MSGTKAGGKAAAETNKRKYGADFYARIGAKGGRRGRTGGFYANRELAREAGRIGGLRSRRLSKDQIKEIIESDLGVTELSKKYGVSRNTIYKYKNGN